MARLRASGSDVLILLLMIVTAYMYLHGSFKYRWFEDGDSWGYAAAAKYISHFKSFSVPYYFNHYIEPYPQGYSLIMGMLILPGLLCGTVDERFHCP